jgi:predicted ATPase
MDFQAGSGTMDEARRLLDDAVIRTPDQRVRVFVSSTLGELADERRAVSRAVEALRLTPVMFELGARPYPPRELYKAYLEQSDIFIGLYWERYGQVAPGMEVSGLEDEFELSRGLPRLLYIKEPAPDREPRLADLVGRIADEASYRTFRTPTELGRLIREDLATLLSERFAASGAATAGASLPRVPRRLPVATTSLIGRAQAIDDVAGLLGETGTRLVTLTGPGGIGKTRLALAVGERLADRLDSGTVFVALAGVTEPEQVLAAIARAVGLELSGTDAPLPALVERFGDARWLLILDNLDYVVDAARDLGELLARCPEVAILATSLAVLQLRGEHEYVVPPLAPPPDPDSVPLDQLASSPAIALFVDRSRAVRPDFALIEGNAPAVVEICRRLEGVPLAIELAAARSRLLDPDGLLRRLAASLNALGTGTVDMPGRHQTLRATVEWSVGLLEDTERSLLETMAVFVDGWTIEAATEVAGINEDEALDLTEALARHSLIYLDVTDRGPRSRMLETIRAFVLEGLASRPDAADVRRRHAEYYRALVEEADRPLRSFGQREWIERLQTEADNLAAAVRWNLDNDPRPLPHLFRMLAVFWTLRDHLTEARSWVNELLPAATALDSRSRAELQWTEALTALEVGDDDAAVAAHQGLAPLLDDIGDPYLDSLSHLAVAWTSPIVGDFDGALERASDALELLRRHDEPFWTAMALTTAGTIELSVRRYDEALPHLTEARDLGERLDNPWQTASSRVQLGLLAAMQGRLEDAHALLDEALSLSLALHTTPLMTLCLGAFGRLALAEGDAVRAAMLVGAADGLRRRAGVRAWPMQRRPETELVDELRQALGGDAFGRAFGSGSGLSRQEAANEARDQRDTGARAA